MSRPAAVRLLSTQVPEGLLPEVKEHNLIRYSDPEKGQYPTAASNAEAAARGCVDDSGGDCRWLRYDLIMWHPYDISTPVTWERA